MASLSTLQKSVATLVPQLQSITDGLKHSAHGNLSETTAHLAAASDALARLLGFLHKNTSHRRNSLPAPAAARANGELQSLIALVFCALAKTEGVAVEGSHNVNQSLAELNTFHETRLSPLMDVFLAVKEAALDRLSMGEIDIDVALNNETSAKELLTANKATIAASSKHLEGVRVSLNTMSAQVAAYGERQKVLEAKRIEMKERQKEASVCIPHALCVAALL